MSTYSTKACYHALKNKSLHGKINAFPFPLHVIQQRQHRDGSFCGTLKSIDLFFIKHCSAQCHHFNVGIREVDIPQSETKKVESMDGKSSSMIF